VETGAANLSELRALTRQSLSKLSAPEAYERQPSVQAKEKEAAATKVQTEQPETAESSQTAPSAVETVEAGASTAEPGGIGLLQVGTYVSFVLGFILAGFAAVMLFRKATKGLEPRFLVGARVLGGALALAAMHGFFATFLYTSYLGSETGTTPLALTTAIWIVLGVAVAIVINHLLTPGTKPKTADLAIDAGSFAAVYVCAMLSVAAGVGPNAAIVLSVLSGLLFFVPVARAMSGFQRAKARHPELRRKPESLLIKSLLYLPAGVPLVAFLHAVGALGPDLTLLMINFLVLALTVLAGSSMIVSAGELSREAVLPAATEEASSTAPASELSGRTVAAKADAAAPKPAPSTPVVKFNAPPPPRPGSGLPSKLPPRKPASGPVAPRREPPKKPGRAGGGSEEEVPAPAVRVKAPSKPKKRF